MPGRIPAAPGTPVNGRGIDWPAGCNPNAIMNEILRRIWLGIVILFMPVVIAYIGIFLLIGWIFRSRAERIVRAYLQATELKNPITSSCLLKSEATAWIVGIDHGCFTGGPERCFRVEKKSRAVEELFGERVFEYTGAAM
jgi:hypothetical protein